MLSYISAHSGYHVHGFWLHLPALSAYLMQGHLTTLFSCLRTFWLNYQQNCGHLLNCTQSACAWLTGASWHRLGGMILGVWRTTMPGLQTMSRALNGGPRPSQTSKTQQKRTTDFKSWTGSGSGFTGVQTMKRLPEFDFRTWRSKQTSISLIQRQDPSLLGACSFYPERFKNVFHTRPKLPS